MNLPRGCAPALLAAVLLCRLHGTASTNAPWEYRGQSPAKPLVRRYPGILRARAGLPAIARLNRVGSEQLGLGRRLRSPGDATMTSTTTGSLPPEDRASGAPLGGMPWWMQDCVQARAEAEEVCSGLSDAATPELQRLHIACGTVCRGAVERMAESCAAGMPDAAESQEALEGVREMLSGCSCASAAWGYEAECGERGAAELCGPCEERLRKVMKACPMEPQDKRDIAHVHGMCGNPCGHAIVEYTASDPEECFTEYDMSGIDTSKVCSVCMPKFCDLTCKCSSERVKPSFFEDWPDDEYALFRYNVWYELGQCPTRCPTCVNPKRQCTTIAEERAIELRAVPCDGGSSEL